MAFLEFLVMNLRLCRGVNGNRKSTNKDVFIPTRSARPSYEKINTLTVGGWSVLDNEEERKSKERDL